MDKKEKMIKKRMAKMKKDIKWNIDWHKNKVKDYTEQLAILELAIKR